MTDSTPQETIRPIVVCLFRHGSRILVCDLYDPATNRALLSTHGRRH